MTIKTTDASNLTLSAVLSLEGKPFMFILKALNSTEINYSNNEEELFSIVWALKTLRSYFHERFGNIH